MVFSLLILSGKGIIDYTQTNLEHSFDDFLEKTSQSLHVSKVDLLGKIKYWYNGYSWNGKEEDKIYNPFSVLLFFEKKAFKNYWFETGTPTLLIKLIEKDKIKPEQLEYLKVTDWMLHATDIQRIDAISLLFQTGYLTIKEIVGTFDRIRYILGFPNEEVRQSFSEHLLSGYMEDGTLTGVGNIAVVMQDALSVKDWTLFFDTANQVFASVPYILFNSKESYYHSLLHVMLTLTGNLVLSEVLTNKGRIDTVLETKDAIVILEFKLDESADAAIKQIQEKGYTERYAKKDKELILIGLNFDSEERKIAEWKIG